jgi:Ca2+-binding RTX toxin-like protein
MRPRLWFRRRARLLWAAALASLVFGIPAGSAAYKGCTIVGTGGPDAILGTERNDVICGRGGGDLISGGGGHDTIRGGPGSDRIEGGSGGDKLYGGYGDDYVNARDGLSDYVDGGPGHDTASREGIDKLISIEGP